MSSTLPVTNTPSTVASVSGAQTSLAGDQTTFIKLLTAQLQNQDPLNPTDPTQFTQQLVAMTGVQQQIMTNQLLQQMVQTKSGFADPVSLIGKTVTVADDSAALKGGQANWFYSLNGAAAGANLQVIDSKGNVVAQTTLGTQTPGEHSFSWNGKDFGGGQLPDGGVYSLKLVAKDSSGGAVTSQVYQRGPATSVLQDNGTPKVTVNGTPLPLSEVTLVAAS